VTRLFCAKLTAQKFWLSLLNKINLNLRYVAETLGALDSEKVMISFLDHQKPVIFETGKQALSDYHLSMPLQF